MLFISRYRQLFLVRVRVSVFFIFFCHLCHQYG